MNKTSNSTEKTTNAQPVFNYAQAAKRSSQNLENIQKPKPNESKPAAPVTETKVEAASVEAPSSFAAALAKNAQPATTTTYVYNFILVWHFLFSTTKNVSFVIS
jgi:hypothetical protein